MDKFQAAFEVLYLLGIIDHQLHSNEVDVINRYIHDNLGQGSYDTHATMNSLNIMSYDGRIQELGYVARFLNSVCNAQEKLHILDFALEVILADVRLTDEESAAFIAIGNVWNIDVRKFTNDRL